MRRGQSEIVGLLVIVIMISMIMLFGLAYCRPPPATDYSSDMLSDAMLDAILQTSTACGESVQNLLIDCARSPDTGGTARYSCPGGLKSCVYSESVVQTIMNRSFDVWQISYEFEVWSPAGEEIYNISKRNARKSMKVRTDSQPLPTTSYSSTMEIKLCIGADKCP
jgi:hypothetical protein